MKNLILAVIAVITIVTTPTASAFERMRLELYKHIEIFSASSERIVTIPVLHERKIPIPSEIHGDYIFSGHTIGWVHESDPKSGSVITFSFMPKGGEEGQLSISMDFRGRLIDIFYEDDHTRIILQRFFIGEMSDEKIMLFDREIEKVRNSHKAVGTALKNIFALLP